MISKQLKKVVFDFECDEFGNCPHCKIDFADCDCPGPMQEDLYKYVEIDGVFWAKKK